MKTYVKNAKEETGQAPACTGALLEIKRVSRQNIKAGASDWSKEFADCAQYIVVFVIQEPKAAKGMAVTDRIRVGTPEDPEAQRKSTWEVSEGGPARFNRLLVRSGTPLPRKEEVADDEQIMSDMIGRTVVAPILKRGEYTNLGLYYRESDKDCPAIGLAEEKGAGKAERRRVAEPEPDEPETEPEPEPDEEGAAEEKETEPPRRPLSGKRPGAQPARRAPVDDEE